MKTIKKVLLVYKVSIFQKYVSSQRKHPLKALYHQKHVATSGVDQSHQAHSSSLKKVKTILKKRGLELTSLRRRHVESAQGYDLVISVGGDGTFLKAAHAVSDQIILGVNSAPSHSVGAYCSVNNIEDFEQRIDQLISGNFSIKKLRRLEISINNKVIYPLALNDVLFANNCPAAMSRYIIKVGSQKEEQRSSGIWVASATGSTAAIYAAGGKKMPSSSNQFQYLIREPHRRGRLGYQLLKGVLSSKQSLSLINRMVESSLFIDGVQNCVPLHFGDKINIKISKKPLQVLV